MLPSDCPPSLVELAVQCAAYEGDERPDAETVFNWVDDLHQHMAEQEGDVDPPLPVFPDFPRPDLVSQRGGEEPVGWPGLRVVCVCLNVCVCYAVQQMTVNMVGTLNKPMQTTGE